MIRKLRWKFVAVCMGLVALVLSAVFGAAYHAVRQNIEDLSRQMLYQVLREDSGRGAVPNPTIEIGGDRVLLPYFTVNIWGDTAYITGGTYADLENTWSRKRRRGRSTSTISATSPWTTAFTGNWPLWICPWSRRCCGGWSVPTC